MRWFTALVIAVTACRESAVPARAVFAPALPPPAAQITPALPRNTVGLLAKELDSPISRAKVSFAAPRFGEQLALANARGYDVRWISSELDADALGVDVALDAQRPRRLPATVSSIALGLLVSADEPLAVGEHWLFAAPVSASGLVPRPAADAPRSAVALEFLIADAVSSTSKPSASESVHTGGALWLRQPEGTYNGARSEQVLIDALAFTETGEPAATRCVIHVAGAARGEHDFPGPFLLFALLNGDYDFRSSSANDTLGAARFITVNRELGRPK